MGTRENEKILRLRNEISLHLDDLVSLVINSALAADLRDFSAEIMELTPGFIFGLKQASALEELTRKTLEQYEKRAMDDVDLMDYFTRARAILKGEAQTVGAQQIGGAIMGILSLLDSKQKKLNKLKEQYRELERRYNEVCGRISALEDEKERCISAAEGHSPDSTVYRNSERAYSSADNKQLLLKQQEVKLKEILEDVDQQITLMEHAKDQDDIIKLADTAMGDEKTRIETIAKVESNNDKLNDKLNSARGFADGILQQAQQDTSATRTDSVFGAKVAAKERRRAMLQNEGVAELEETAGTEEQKSEFFRRVSGAGSKE